MASAHHGDAGSSLLPAIAVANPVSQVDCSPSHFHLPTVIVHPDIEPSASDNMLTQPPLLDGTHMSFTAAPSIDFLDYLDAGGLDSTACGDVQYGDIATGVGCNHAMVDGGNPANHWVPTPDRPRMFPRKLY